MQVKSFIGGFDKNLCYLVWCKKTRLASIIDPSVESLEIFEFIESQNLILEKILITHTHRDHISYLDDFIYKYPLINIYCHANPVNNFKKIFIPLDNNQAISIGDSLLTILYTPGHFPDSVCYWNKEKKIIFTGDTVFIGRTGRTVSQGSNIKDLYHSIYNIILNLPHETLIYPGHHYGFSKSDSILFNIKNSPFFQCSQFTEFVEVMENFERNRKK
jgi:glyoxylase-like metal-dependent hydrolase (beta-lactamase superfamily II)